MSKSHPKNWRKVKLKDIVDVFGGGTPSTKNQDYWNGDIPWLTPAEVTTMNQRFIKNTERFITKDGLDNSSAQLMPQNSLLLTSRATIGEVVINKVPMSTNQGFINIKPKNVDLMYMYYWLKQNKRYLKQIAIGSTFDELSKSVFKQIDTYIPSKREDQRRIASILSAFDDKIELNNKINQTLEQMAQAIFKEWFVNFRFPGHEEVKRVDSELGKVPEGWETCKLSDMLDNVADRYQGNNAIDKLNYLPIDNIPSKSLAILEIAAPEEAQSSLIKFENNDILFGAMRPYFFKVAIAPFKGLTRTTCFVLRPKNKEYLAFCIMFLFRQEIIDHATNISQGSTIPYVKWDNSFSELMLVKPDKETITKFNLLVAPIIRIIQGSFFENIRLKKLRDLLLPKLMSGEVRV